MTKEQLLERIKNEPGTAKYYLLLAFMLGSPQETVTLLKQDPLDPDELPVVMTQQQLFLKTIQLDGAQALAYLALKNQLEDGEVITLNDGRILGKRALILEAIHRAAGEPLPYSALAFEIEAGETAVLLDGRRLNRYQLLLEAVHLDRQLVLLWNRARYFVTPPGTVTLPDGRELTQQELVTAIIPRPSEDNPLENEPLDSQAAAGLVLTMEPGAEIFIPDRLPLPSDIGPPPGQNKKREELAVEAAKAAYEAAQEAAKPPGVPAETMAGFGYPFMVLALTLNPDETVDTGIIGVGTTGHMGLLREAIRLSPVKAEYYLFGGLWLKPGEKILLSDGRQKNQKEMLLNVLELDPANALGHLGLGYTIGAAETVTVTGKSMNRQQLMQRAAALDPGLDVAYLCLAFTLDPDDQAATVAVNGEEMSAGQLFDVYNTLNKGG